MPSDETSDGDTVTLDDLGLHEGEAVRWRRHDGGNWQTGVVIGCESDGSIAVRDRDGAWRSIVAERLEAKRPGRKGKLVWQTVAEAAAAPAQLTLWAPTAPGPSGPGPKKRSAARTRRAPVTLRPTLKAR